MKEIVYNDFLAKIYDDSPCFGRARNKELDKFNKPYYDNLKSERNVILEFGSGTGLLTIPLAKRGYRVESVDISQYMHEVILEKLCDETGKVKNNISLILDDALTYVSSHKYSSIVMPEGIIIALSDIEQQRRLLMNCNRNLEIGGKMYFDCFQPNYKIIKEKNVQEYTRFQTKKQEIYIMSVKYTNNEHTQLQNLDITYSKMERNRIIDEINIKVDFRYLFYSELMLMLEMAGFKAVIDTHYADDRGFFVIAEKIFDV